VVEIQVRYEGSLRCEAVHGPSSNRVLTDAPVDNNGRGESFSPTDLVATALGSCMLTIMGMVAERNGWETGGLRARVVKEMVADPDRRIGRLTVEILVPAELDERARKVLERAALTCPVHKSLRPEIEIPVEFVYGSSDGVDTAGGAAS
jgi:putative redox protein